MVEKIQDITVVFCLMEGRKLWDWQRIGVLDRQISFFKSIARHVGKFIVISHGADEDREIAKNVSGVSFICNEHRKLQEQFLAELPQLIKEESIGRLIFRSDQTLGAELPKQLAAKTGGLFIARCGYLLSRFEHFKHGGNSEQYRSALELERKIFLDADHCIVTAQYMKNEFMRLGVDEDRIGVIPNFVDLDTFSPDENSTASNKERDILFVGRLQEQKNPLLLLDAVKGQNLNVDIVGSGPMQKQIEQKAKDHHIEVRFYGNLRQTELKRLLNESKIYVQPSNYEGHPKTLIEAMACGAPVIGTDVEGIREVIDHRRTGLLVQSSVDDLAQAISELIQNKTLCDKLGKAAYEEVRKNLSLERVVEIEIDTYRHMMN